MNLLIVDDNMDAATSLSCYLEMSGHMVHVAYDGHEALSACANFSYDIIILDLDMPKINGYEVCRILRTSNFCGKIFALTGHAEKEDKAKTQEVGFDLHLTKPLNPKDLEQLLPTSQGG